MFKILILFQGTIICAEKCKKQKQTQNSIYINGKLSESNGKNFINKTKTFLT